MRIRAIKVSGVLFCLFISFGLAQATILTPDSYTALSGTTSAAEPQLAGIVLVDETQAFSFAAYGGIVSGDVQIRVVRSSVDNTIDFYWRVFNNASSAGAIQDLRLGSFIAPEYNANYRTDGLGDIGPDQAYLFGDTLAGLGYINFNFSNGLAPGDDSLFFFMDTTAMNFAKTAVFDLTNIGQTQISSQYATYAPAVPEPAPAVPEPATVLLLGLGLIGMAGVRRFRK